MISFVSMRPGTLAACKRLAGCEVAVLSSLPGLGLDGPEHDGLGPHSTRDPPQDRRGGLPEVVVVPSDPDGAEARGLDRAEEVGLVGRPPEAVRPEHRTRTDGRRHRVLRCDVGKEKSYSRPAHARHLSEDRDLVRDEPEEAVGG